MFDLDYHDSRRIVLMTLKRPPANAFSLDGLLSFRDAIMELNARRAVRALVITGDGPKFFSAGADLNTFADGAIDVARLAASRFGEAFETLQNSRMVVIAAINGYAMGGGLECALASDMRIVESHAVLALPETAVGLLPCGCGTQTLPWLVGEGWAKRMILSGERVDASTALRIGLAEEVVEIGTSVSTAMKIAERVVRLSPEGVEFSKGLIHQARQGVPRTAALAVERERFVALFDYANQREGVNAFLEKRSPVWHGDGLLIGETPKDKQGGA